MTLEERIEHIEAMLTQLVERQAVKDFYTPEEFAHLVGREAFTCREYCRLGRIINRALFSRYHHERIGVVG